MEALAAGFQVCIPKQLACERCARRVQFECASQSYFVHQLHIAFAAGTQQQRQLSLVDIAVGVVRQRFGVMQI